MRDQHLIIIGWLICLCGGSTQLDQMYDSYPNRPGVLPQMSTSRIKHPENVHNGAVGYARFARSSQPDSDSQSPQIVYSHSPNVTAIIHETVHLNCRVRGVRNNTVSWIRHKDKQLLTAGGYTYTSDRRFRVIYEVKTEDYVLEIDFVQASDAGLYECQVSNGQELTRVDKSHYVYLEVAEHQTSILGGPDIYISEGDTLSITCLAGQGSEESPQNISWHHNQQSFSRGVISQITDKTITASYLLVHKARLADSGQYSCRPSTGNSTSVSVHVHDKSKDPTNWTVSSSTGAQLQSIGIIFLYIFVTTFCPTFLLVCAGFDFEFGQ